MVRGAARRPSHQHGVRPAPLRRRRHRLAPEARADNLAARPAAHIHAGRSTTAKVFRTACASAAVIERGTAPALRAGAGHLARRALALARVRVLLLTRRTGNGPARTLACVGVLLLARRTGDRCALALAGLRVLHLARRTGDDRAVAGARVEIDDASIWTGDQVAVLLVGRHRTWGNFDDLERLFPRFRPVADGDFVTLLGVSGEGITGDETPEGETTEEPGDPPAGGAATQHAGEIIEPGLVQGEGLRKRLPRAAVE